MNGEERIMSIQIIHMLIYENDRWAFKPRDGNWR
jgi:two-component sensor histidine kinase